MGVKKEKGQLTTVFSIATFALLAFGIAAQLMSEAMGYTPMLTDYFSYLLPMIAGGFLAHYLIIKLRNGGKFWKIFLNILLIIVLLWSALCIVAFTIYQFDRSSQQDTYGNGWYLSWVDLKEETQYMLSKCHLFGHGDAYYQYPDDLIDPDVYIIDDLPQDVQEAIMERDRVGVFRHYRWDRILPVLSYTYGFWVTILFGVITIGWCLSAIASFRKLNTWWEKAAYGICSILIAVQLIYPLLGGLGVVACLIPHPFSMDWRMTLLDVIPQLGIIFALMKTSHLNAPERATCSSPQTFLTDICLLQQLEQSLSERHAHHHPAGKCNGERKNLSLRRDEWYT